MLTSRESVGPFEVDFTGRFSGRASMVVQPATAWEVSGVLAACAETGSSVVTQGGRTGLVGGAVPLDGEVVLSLARLRELGDVDHASRQVTVGAGCTLDQVAAHVGPHGLQFAVTHGAREQATIGGAVATNAGGARAVRHGVTRQHVAGVEVVLSDGTIVSRLSGLAKDTAGYDISQMVCGSEGTLGVITRVRLKLTSIPAARTTVAVGMEGIDEALELVSELRDADGDLEAAEFFTATEVELAQRAFSHAFPLSGSDVYLLLEWAHDQAEAELSDTAMEVLGRHANIAVATGARQREKLWKVRDELTLAVSTEGVPSKYDVALPLGQLARFDAELQRELAAADGELTLYRWGHAGDGNVHVNVVGSGLNHRVDEIVLRLCVSLGGSISAEHGIGRAKVRWLGLMRSQAELALMRDIKAAFDPGFMLNPGVVVEAPA